MERIAKFIARCGIASRRKAEMLISQDKVCVNGRIVTEVGTKIHPETDIVLVNNKRIAPSHGKYFLFHKPVGVITTKCDTHTRKTVLDFFPRKHRDIHPVGRLDKDTSGLLFLTNDGALTYTLTHPRYGVPKTYVVRIRGAIQPDHLQQLRKGIRLKDGPTQPAVITVVKKKGKKMTLTVRIKEGRKRQIRRMFAALGYPVLALQRIATGPLRLGVLKVGAYRLLTSCEVRQLQESIRERS